MMVIGKLTDGESEEIEISFEKEEKEFDWRRYAAAKGDRVIEFNSKMTQWIFEDSEQ